MNNQPKDFLDTLKSPRKTNKLLSFVLPEPKLNCQIIDSEVLFKNCNTRCLERIKRSSLDSEAFEADRTLIKDYKKDGCYSYDTQQNNKLDCSYLKNFQVVGSYSWGLDSTPTKPIIVIPGESAHILTELPKEDFAIPKSSISLPYIFDKNQSEYPDFPIEPIYQSVIQCCPEYDLTNVDVIVSDSRILNQLLRFVENRPEPYFLKFLDSFRVDFQRIGNSIVISMDNQMKPEKICDGCLECIAVHDTLPQHSHFSEGFEAKMTEKNLLSRKHYKIVSYKLGDLNLLVRIEADYCDNGSETELSALMSGVDLNNNNDLPCAIDDSKLSLVKRGTLLDNKKTELFFMEKDHSQNVLRWDTMFFTKIENILLGRLKPATGSFGDDKFDLVGGIEKISYDEVTSRCNRTKESIHDSMSKLMDLLTKLRDLALSQLDENAKYSAVFVGGNAIRLQTDDCLDVFKCKTSSMVIPVGLASKIYGETKLKKMTYTVI